MIFIISITLMLSFVLGGIYLRVNPNMYSLVEKDIAREAKAYATLEGLRYADLKIRAKENIPVTAGTSTNEKHEMGYLTKTGSKELTQSACNITINKDATTLKLKITVNPVIEHTN